MLTDHIEVAIDAKWNWKRSRNDSFSVFSVFRYWILSLSVESRQFLLPSMFFFLGKTFQTFGLDYCLSEQQVKKATKQSCDIKFSRESISLMFNG